MEKLIITGATGLIGKRLTKSLTNEYEILPLDISLGHDLANETFVKEWFSVNKAKYLVNLFALNDHVEESQAETDLFNVSLESIQNFCRINLIALFSVCREFARNNRENTSIVNFSSTYGLVSPRPDMYGKSQKHIGYSISKGGVLQMTRHLAAHLAPDVRVNCVIPGGVKHQQGQKFIESYSSNTPMGRMLDADELTGIIKYLCSDDSSYTTGADFVIDGGWTII